MEPADIALCRGREMPHTGHTRLPERPVSGPLGKAFVDRGVVPGRLPLGSLWYGEALPLHARIQEPQDEMKDAIIAPCALWTALGHRQVWQETCGELACGELAGIGVVAGVGAVVLIMQ